MLPKKLIGVRVGKRPFNLPSLGGPQRAVRGDGCLPNLAANDPAQVFPGGPVVKTPSSNAGGGDLIPGQRTKIPHVLRSKNQNIKQKQYCNAFNNDFKNWSISKNKTKKMAQCRGQGGHRGRPGTKWASPSVGSTSQFLGHCLEIVPISFPSDLLNLLLQPLRFF